MSSLTWLESTYTAQCWARSRGMPRSMQSRRTASMLEEKLW